MRTAFGYSPALEHDFYNHPENARRGTTTIQLLRDSGLLDDLVEIESRQASRAMIKLAHAGPMIERLEQFALRGGGLLDQDTYVTDLSYFLALEAAGTTAAVAESIAKGEAKNGFVFVRPPGHHAESQRSMGFCLFNNVAVAARHLQQTTDIEKVMIIDVDVHHGNGTQEIFYSDPSVMFLSTHQYGRLFYPGTGSLEERGTGAGSGFNLNVPLMDGVGDAGYLAIIDEIIYPATLRFNPDFMIISIGFDAHWMDPLSTMGLSLRGFGAMTQRLIEIARDVCDEKILFVQEGGYDLNVLATGVLNTLAAMNKVENFLDPMGNSRMPEPDVSPLIQKVKSLHLIN